MPPTTALATFAHALLTGKTKITLALDEAFTPPYTGGGLPPAKQKAVAQLARSGSSGKPAGGNVQQWVKDVLNTLVDAEFNHMGDWPEDQKESLRSLLDTHVKANRSVRFFWRLTDAAYPTYRVNDPGPPGPVVVTFLTPQSLVMHIESDLVEAKVKA